MGGREKNTYSSFSAHLTLISDVALCLFRTRSRAPSRIGMTLLLLTARFPFDHNNNFSRMSGARKGGRFAKSKPAGSHKSLKVAGPRLKALSSSKQAASEAITFVNESVSSIHQHNRAWGAAARAVHVKAAAVAVAKAQRAAARTVNDASPHLADVKQGVRYTKVVSHTPGGGGDGSSSKSRLSDHGGNQP